jgi:hypothetical protein
VAVRYPDQRGEGRVCRGRDDSERNQAIFDDGQEGWRTAEVVVLVGSHMDESHRTAIVHGPQTNFGITLLS